MSGEKIAIVGELLNGSCVSSLTALGYRVIVLPKDSRLSESVAAHTDLLVFPLGDLLFCYGGEVGRLLSLQGLHIISVDEVPNREYPRDIYLNALVVGKYIFANEKYLSAAIRAESERRGYSVINVRQGYARCTACPIGENAIITADVSIARAAASVGIEVLPISSGGVELTGYSYGFIGGACGVDTDRVFFAGDIYTHPDGERIVEFCEKRGKEVISLCGGSLCDVGSIFFIK